jgi:hypothetical protein
MGTISARPSALRHYAATFTLEDGRLQDRADQLRSVLDRYRAGSEVAQAHSGAAEHVRALGRAGASLAGRVQRIAAAFEQVDAVADSNPDGGAQGVRRVDHASFVSAYARLARLWEDVHYLGDLVVHLDQERWFDLLWARRCPPLTGGDYTGGGGLVGPDGRVYPLVIPELEIGGRRANLTFEPIPALDPATLGGQDTGWVEIDRRVGVARVIEYEAGPLGRAATALAVGTGLATPRHQWAPADMLARVVFTQGGRPQIDELPPRLLRDPRLGPVDVPEPWKRDSRRSGVFDLVTGAVEGVDLAVRLDDPGVNVYRVVFEEHEEGGRRARMYTHQLQTTEHGSQFVTMMGYGVDGKLRRKPAQEAAPHGRPMSQGPHRRSRAERQHAIGPRGPQTTPLP